MHNLKFCNKLLSLMVLTYKQNNLWFDIILTKNIYSLLFIFQKIGIVTSFYIFNKNINNCCRVFLKYLNLEISLMLPIFFYFKPSHKLSISLKKLIKLNKTLGSTTLIISTNRGLKLHTECINLKIGGILYLIIYT